MTPKDEHEQSSKIHVWQHFSLEKPPHEEQEKKNDYCTLNAHICKMEQRTQFRIMSLNK